VFILIAIINIIAFSGLINWANNEQNKDNNEFGIKQGIFLILSFPFGTIMILFLLLVYGIAKLTDCDV